MPAIGRYTVPAPNKVSFTTTPGDNVTGYAGKLFFYQDVTDPDAPVTLRETWTSDDLEHGVSFDFDAAGNQHYQIAIAATASSATTLDTTVTFETAIDPSHHVVDLDPDTLNEPTWEFSPL